MIPVADEKISSSSCNSNNNNKTQLYNNKKNNSNKDMGWIILVYKKALKFVYNHWNKGLRANRVQLQLILRIIL